MKDLSSIVVYNQNYSSPHNIGLEAKGLLLGKRNDLAIRKIKENFYKRFDLEDIEKLKNLSSKETTWLYSRISDLLLELFQDVGIDLIYDYVQVYDSKIEFLLRYANDFTESFTIEIDI
jgi:hypothetical protein